MLKRYVILIDRGDGTTVYKITRGAKALKVYTDMLKLDSSVEYYEVIEGETVTTWSNPGCCP